LASIYYLGILNKLEESNGFRETEMQRLKGKKKTTNTSNRELWYFVHV
jgi:hypothetical protein